MKLDKQTMFKIGGLIVFTVLVVACCFRFDVVISIITGLIGLFTPFLIGLVMAFIVNILMRFLERVIFGNRFAKKKRLLQKIKRPVSIVLAILLILGVVLAVFWIVVPQLGDAATNAISNLESAVPRLKNWLHVQLSAYPDILEKVDTIFGKEPNWPMLFSNVITFLKSGSIGGLDEMFSTASAMVGELITSVSTFVIAFVFACYILGQKEKLRGQTARVIRAFLPKPGADWLAKLYHLCSRTFSSFITGQCLEACILFIIYFAVLAIGGFPYAVLIAVIVAFMSFIPIFGCYLSCIIGALLILTVSSFQAIVFVILFIIIQQIEGNMIYPRVVGGSIGLPGIWVLLAVSVGGSLFGIVGMLAFIPLTSVVYTLVREEVHKRMERKQMIS